MEFLRLYGRVLRLLAADRAVAIGLVLAALVSEGETTVDGAFHIDRGYPNFAEQLVKLGAKVARD
jgi:UDP-N-acetylglucosamine 1-carboxyvinyltransferase